ncbi:MAG: hypothetical protein WCT37_03435 [Patescibacteria group bacterium]
MNRFQEFWAEIKRVLAYGIGFLVGVAILLIVGSHYLSHPVAHFADFSAAVLAEGAFVACLFLRLWVFEELAIFDPRKSLVNNTLRLTFWELYLAGMILCLLYHHRRGAPGSAAG